MLPFSPKYLFLVTFDDLVVPGSCSHRDKDGGAFLYDLVIPGGATNLLCGFGDIQFRSFNFRLGLAGSGASKDLRLVGGGVGTTLTNCTSSSFSFVSPSSSSRSTYIFGILLDGRFFCPKI